MTADYRDLITRMAKELDDYRQLLLDDRTVTHRLSNEARAALAHWGNPAPTPPADGEVAELVETLKGIAYWKRHGKLGEPAPASFDIRQADRLNRAADLLERPSPPQPVPVSERPWEREGWCDVEGRFWAEHISRSGVASWRCAAASDLGGWAVRCLPAHALPLPDVGE